MNKKRVSPYVADSFLLLEHENWNEDIKQGAFSPY
jgi:hypothetical protein